MRYASHNRRTTLCFTIMEIVIVIVIIAILAAIVIPNFLESQERKNKSEKLPFTASTIKC